MEVIMRSNQTGHTFGLEVSDEKPLAQILTLDGAVVTIERDGKSYTYEKAS